MSDAKLTPILMVDDEPLVLAGYRRSLGRIFSITCAEGGAPALEAIQNSGPFPVVVTDMRMPQMSGLEFINEARNRSRDTVFMMLTGNADQQTVVNAVNHAQIFRFLNKPCPPEMLDGSIRAAIRQHELITAERVLLRETFAGSIKFMVEALELANPEIFAFQNRAKQILQQVCAGIGIRNDWQLSIAGSLCLIGLLTFPEVSAKNGLSDERLVEIAYVGAGLLKHIPRIDTVVSMVRRQREPSAPLPPDLKTLFPEAYETLGAQLLRFCVDLAREERRVNDRAAAARQLQRTGKYDPRLIDAFIEKTDSVKSEDEVNVQVSVFDLVPGMIVTEDVRSRDGAMLLCKGLTVSQISIASLQNAAERGVIGKLIPILVETPVIAVCA